MTAQPLLLRAKLAAQIRRFGRFGLVGVLATLTHVGVVVAAVEAFGGDPRWANPLGVALAMPVAYFGRYSFSFGSSHAHHTTVPRFILAAHLALGAEIWRSFLDSVRVGAGTFADNDMIWRLYTTPYGAMRMIGAAFWPAVAFQVAMASAVLWLLMRIWRSPQAPAEMKAAVFCFAMAVATPRMLY